jgi:hypothetical protein
VLLFKTEDHEENNEIYNDWLAGLARDDNDFLFGLVESDA